MGNESFGEIWDGDIDLDALLKNEDESDAPFSSAPLGNEDPQPHFVEMLAEVNRSDARFRKTRAMPPFALIVSPADKMNLQWLAHEFGEGDICEWGDSDQLVYGELVVEAAAFVEGGRYVILCQEDYDDLAAEGLFL